MTELPQFNTELGREVTHRYCDHSRIHYAVTTASELRLAETQARFPLHRYHRLAPLLHGLRLVKSAHEIEMIRLLTLKTAWLMQ